MTLETCCFPSPSPSSHSSSRYSSVHTRCIHSSAQDVRCENAYVRSEYLGQQKSSVTDMLPLKLDSLLSPLAREKEGKEERGDEREPGVGEGWGWREQIRVCRGHKMGWHTQEETVNCNLSYFPLISNCVAFLPSWHSPPPIAYDSITNKTTASIRTIILIIIIVIIKTVIVFVAYYKENVKVLQLKSCVVSIINTK